MEAWIADRRDEWHNLKSGPINELADALALRLLNNVHMAGLDQRKHLKRTSTVVAVDSPDRITAADLRRIRVCVHDLSVKVRGSRLRFKTKRYDIENDGQTFTVVEVGVTNRKNGQPISKANLKPVRRYLSRLRRRER